MIIFLNGVSSSGKTTLARRLLQDLPEYFHCSVDDFDLLIERMEDRDNKRLIPVATELFFHRTVAMFADHEVNLIVDHVLHTEAVERDCLQVLQGYPVLFVGVHCPLAELERRERERGDRSVGLAKAQLEYVHTNDRYDVEVNSVSDSIDTAAQRIIEALRQGVFPKGWAATHQRLSPLTTERQFGGKED